MSNSSSTGLPSLTKWQLAIILGTPVAAGLGYLCYKNMCKELSPDSAKDSDKKKIKEKTADTIPRPKVSVSVIPYLVLFLVDYIGAHPLLTESSYRHYMVIHLSPISGNFKESSHPLFLY